MVKVIGITGNSGAGKGAVCRILADNGVTVLNCDKIAHEVMLKGAAAYGEVVAEFHDNNILKTDGEIDRAKLGAVVFADADKRKRLEGIVHGYVAEYCADFIARATNSITLVAIDAPLLIEANMHGYCDQVWVITAAYNTRLKRITERDGIGEEAAKARLAAQTPTEELAVFADAVIENNGELEDLRETVGRLLANGGYM